MPAVEHPGYRSGSALADHDGKVFENVRLGPVGFHTIGFVNLLPAAR